MEWEGWMSGWWGGRDGPAGGRGWERRFPVTTVPAPACRWHCSQARLASQRPLSLLHPSPHTTMSSCCRCLGFFVVGHCDRVGDFRASRDPPVWHQRP